MKKKKTKTYIFLNHNKRTIFVDRFLVMFYFSCVSNRSNRVELVRALLKPGRNKSVLFINPTKEEEEEEEAREQTSLTRHFNLFSLESCMQVRSIFVGNLIE